MERLGEKLRALRTSRGHTLEEVSQAVGYGSHTYLSEVESGQTPKTPAELVLKLARFFGVSTDVLLRDELDLPEEALRRP